MKRFLSLLSIVVAIGMAAFTVQAGGHGGHASGGGGWHGGGGCWGGGWHGGGYWGGGYCGGWWPGFSVGFYPAYYSYPVYYSYPAYPYYYYPVSPAPSAPPATTPNPAPQQAPTAYSTHSQLVAQPYKPGSSSVVLVTAPLTPISPRPAYVYTRPATAPAQQQYYGSVTTKSSATAAKTVSTTSANTTGAVQTSAGQAAGYAVAH